MRTPANVNLEQLRDTIIAISNEMGGKLIYQHNEQGTFVVRQLDGSLRVEPIVVGTAIGVNPVANVTNGEVIVAMIHTHVPNGNPDLMYPSSPNNSTNGRGDTTDMQAMMQTGHVDPEALYYIVDTSTALTYEYTWIGPMGGIDITRDTVYY